jgi:hypothetical protein
MARIWLAMLFCLFAVSVFGQDGSVSSNQPQIRFHYALVGSANGVNVSISLDGFVIPWIAEYAVRINSVYGQDPPRALEMKKEMRNKLNMDAELYFYTARVTNETGHSLGLNAFSDVLTLQEGRMQKEYRPDPAYAYPLKLLNHSQVEIGFPIVERADKFDSINNAVSWTKQNEELLKMAPLVLKERANVLVALGAAARGIGKTFFGDLSLGTAGVTVPLASEITLAN